MVTFSPFDKWEYLTDLETCHAYIREQDTEIEKMRGVIFTLAMINRDNMTEHDEALLEDAIANAKAIYNEV